MQGSQTWCWSWCWQTKAVFLSRSYWRDFYRVFPKIDYPQNRGFSKLKVKRKHHLDVEYVDYIFGHQLWPLGLYKKGFNSVHANDLCTCRSNIGMSYKYSGVKSWIMYTAYEYFGRKCFNIVKKTFICIFCMKHFASDELVQGNLFSRASPFAKKTKKKPTCNKCQRTGSQREMFAIMRILGHPNIFWHGNKSWFDSKSV